MGNGVLRLMQAAAYPGLSRMKLSWMVQLAYIKSSLDKRAKLFRCDELNCLRDAPRPCKLVGSVEVAQGES